MLSVTCTTLSLPLAHHMRHVQTINTENQFENHFSNTFSPPFYFFSPKHCFSFYLCPQEEGVL